MGLLYFFALVILGYSTGRYIEKRHFADLKRREEKFATIPMVSAQWKGELQGDIQSRIIGGEVVIGADYFKSMVAGLRSIFGGRLSTFESLLDRARREAQLRMLEKAHNWRADKIINVRMETTVIGQDSGKKAIPCVEIHCYGTAIRDINREVRS